MYHRHNVICRCLGAVIGFICLLHLSPLININGLANREPTIILRSRATPSPVPINGEERARLVWERCKNVRKNTPPPCPYKVKHPNVRLLPLPQHNMLMCAVGKTGTSNWKTLILLIKGRINDTEAKEMLYPHGQQYFNGRKMGNLRYLPKEEPDLYKKIMQEWYKFTFVRDPLSRFLSAYRDKFTGESEQREFAAYQNLRGRMMCIVLRIEFAERGDTPRELHDYVAQELDKNCFDGTEANKTVHVSLGMMVVFLIFTPTNVAEKHQAVLRSQGKVYDLIETRINAHWTNMISLCGHCSEKYRYDFIGTVETMSEDTEFLRSRFGIKYPLPSINSTQPGAASSKQVRKMYEDLPDFIKQYLLKYLQFDAQIFGYSGYDSNILDSEYPNHNETENCALLGWT